MGLHYENITQMLLESMADFLDEHEVLVEQSMTGVVDPIAREKSELHIRMAKAAMLEYKKTMKNDY